MFNEYGLKNIEMLNETIIKLERLCERENITIYHYLVYINFYNSNNEVESFNAIFSESDILREIENNTYNRMFNYNINITINENEININFYEYQK